MRMKILTLVAAACTLASCSSRNGAQPTATAVQRTPSAAPASTATAAAVPSSSPACDDRSSGPAATLDITDFAFDTKCFAVEPTQGLSLRNHGAVEHNFSIENVPGIDVEIGAGQTNNTEATNLSPGTYTFFCKFHRSQGMEGTLEVKG